ncbi:hypothetical protein L0P88_17450 [Muricauda sp. SCSIO 64092]|uniref:hypothetical protein n=1 Tax=Allomuricauda sp. SCSIO 64092 TaxID=2908842 RepID=UPI001FF14A43|nr:hypothetical protein [Muricauda sp. SCSIO 64092]UOY05722.1 hypothetical protein L0P88_17450 [Muricauda sp. SCSIO 64092]
MNLGSWQSGHDLEFWTVNEGLAFQYYGTAPEMREKIVNRVQDVFNEALLPKWSKTKCSVNVPDGMGQKTLGSSEPSV